MTDWYRKKTWAKTDEDEFFSKLQRAQEDNRAQYLRVQAIELIETGNKELLNVAEILLNKILIDYPDNKIEKSQVFNSLGEIYEKKKDYEKALEYFRKSLAFEKEFPNVVTTAYLNFSETVIRARKTELYGEVEKLLIEEIKKDTLKFPVEKYIIYSVLSVISDFKGNIDEVKNYSLLAEENATTETNGLWSPKKRKFGVVKNRKTWLDKLLRRKAS